MAGLDKLGRLNPLVGRPVLYTKDIEIPMSEDMLQELSAKAKAKGVTRAELIRTYITWGLEQDNE